MQDYHGSWTMLSIATVIRLVSTATPRPNSPPQYPPPLLATAPGIVAEVNQAQQSCSAARTGPPLLPFTSNSQIQPLASKET